MKSIKVLSTGCCDSLFQTVRNHIQARADAHHFEVEQITDLEKVYAYGVMDLPAILVEDEALIVGERSKDELLEEINKLLT